MLPPLETRSDCVRVSAAACKPAAPTTSHSPGGRLTRNDEPAGRVPVALSKRSLNLLWLTGLPATDWESGSHVSIKDLSDPDMALARDSFSSKAGRVSIALPYDPPPSEFFHKYLNNQSLVPNQGLDSAHPDSIPSLLNLQLWSGGGGRCEGTSPSGIGTRHEVAFSEEEGPIQARFRGGRGGDSGPVRNA